MKDKEKNLKSKFHPVVSALYFCCYSTRSLSLSCPCRAALWEQPLTHDATLRQACPSLSLKWACEKISALSSPQIAVLFICYNIKISQNNFSIDKHSFLTQNEAQGLETCLLPAPISLQGMSFPQAWLFQPVVFSGFFGWASPWNSCSTLGKPAALCVPTAPGLLPSASLLVYPEASPIAPSDVPKLKRLSAISPTSLYKDKQWFV